MANAFRKDIWRTIIQSRKRFISILVICVLGVTMVTGLRASCFDLRNSADAFFDTQGLYDISIQSTLGLTTDDVSEITQIEGVEKAEGTWEESTYTDTGSQRLSVGVKALSADGINAPYLVSGELPTTETEVAVTQNYLNDTGASIGDTVTLEDNGDNAIFKRCEYTITGTVVDPTELTNPTGPIAIRASASPDCCFFVTQDAVDPDVSDTFTALYIKAANVENLSCYSDDYDSVIEMLTDRIEAIRSEREQARTDEIKQDAYDTIDEQESEAEKGFADAEEKLADAQAQIDSGWADINSNKWQLEDGKQQLEDGEAELKSQAKQLADGRAQIEDGLDQIADGKAQLEASIETGRAQINAEVDAKIAEINSAFGNPTDPEIQLTPEQYAQYTAALEQAEQGRQDALSAFETEIANQKADLAATEEELNAQLDQIKEGEAALEAGRQQLEVSKQEIASGEQQIEKG